MIDLKKIGGGRSRKLQSVANVPFDSLDCLTVEKILTV